MLPIFRRQRKCKNAQPVLPARCPSSGLFKKPAPSLLLSLHHAPFFAAFLSSLFVPYAPSRTIPLRSPVFAPYHPYPSPPRSLTDGPCSPSPPPIHCPFTLLTTFFPTRCEPSNFPPKNQKSFEKKTLVVKDITSKQHTSTFQRGVSTLLQTKGTGPSNHHPL